MTRITNISYLFMKFVRLGNDIQINWTITRLDSPEDFSDKELTVKLYAKCGCPQKFDFYVEGNVIKGTFYGKDQTDTGSYRLELVENEGKENMVTLDYVDAFCLSKTLKNHTNSGHDSSSSIVTEIIDISSSIDTGSFVETDPIFTASPAAKITDEEIEKWNTPVDLSDFPTKEEVAVELEQKQDILNHYKEKEYSATIEVEGQNNESADLTLAPNRTVLGHYGDGVKTYGEILINDNETNITHGEKTLRISNDGKLYFDNKEIKPEETLETLNWRQFDSVAQTPKKTCWVNVTKIFGPGMNNGYDGSGYTFYNDTTNDVIQLFFKRH